MAEPHRPQTPDMPPELLELKRRFMERLPGYLEAITELFHALSNGRWEDSAGET